MEALKDELLSRSGQGARYGLERMRSGLDALANPERGLAAVHVAGTNGKGSVCAMVEAIARRAGLRTGTFTSPHLCRLNERIRLDGEPIDDARLGSALARVLAPTCPWLTFFEAVTAASFVAMGQAQVDLGIVEVGLGGRLDATNVLVDPVCCAITSIAADHTRILGSGDANIATEKAGIVKRGCPVVIGPVSREAASAILGVATAVASGPVWMVARDETEERAVRELGAAPLVVWRTAAGLSLRSPDGQHAEIPRLGLAGPHQLDNAAVAAGVVWLAAPRLGLSPAGLAGAMAVGLETASWPGRFERLQRGELSLLLDCAHNPHGAAALARAVAELGLSPARTRLVFGAMSDKPWQEMLSSIGPLAHSRYYCEPIRELSGRLPADPHELAAQLPGQAFTTPEEALAQALAEAHAGDTVLVAGSIFLVGAVRGLLTGQARDVVVAL